MNKLAISIFFLVSLTTQSYSQKSVVKTFAANGIKGVAIVGDKLFKISTTTNKDNSIVAKASFEGEHQNNLALTANDEDGILTLNVNWTPVFKDPDDKLSAHKVISAHLELSMPEMLSLDVKSDNAILFINGNYNAVKAVLGNGNCNIKGRVKSVDISTINGSINASTSSAQIITEAKKTNVVLQDVPSGTDLWKLSSVNGKIMIHRLK